MAICGVSSGSSWNCRWSRARTVAT